MVFPSSMAQNHPIDCMPAQTAVALGVGAAYNGLVSPPSAPDAGLGFAMGRITLFQAFATLAAGIVLLCSHR